MITKLNELRMAADSKQLEIQACHAMLVKFQSEKQSLEEEIALAEELAKEAPGSGFIKLKCLHFSFPWHYMGGANPNDRTYGQEVICYFEPEQAHGLLIKGEVLAYGSGVKYAKA